MTVERTHSTWFHFTKSPKYFAAVDEVREPHQEPGRISSQPEGGGYRRGGIANNGFGLEGIRDREYNPLGKLPGSVWTLDTRACLERIVKGWSPSGICTKCGEGRRPVVDSKRVKSPVHSDGSIMGHRSGGPDERGWDGLPRFNMERTVTGYACACPEPTAPTTAPQILISGFDALPLAMTP